MREIRILREVLQDIAEAADWYASEGNRGLGDRFVATFYSYLLEIERSGEIYRTVYLDFRKILLRPFPYSVFYRLHQNTWVVTLAIHAARRPRLARKILRNRK
jgi:hypothetical protein